MGVGATFGRSCQCLGPAHLDLQVIQKQNCAFFLFQSLFIIQFRTKYYGYSRIHQ